MLTGDVQIRLGDILYAVMKKWKIVLLSTVLGLIIGIFMVGFQSVRDTKEGYTIDSSFVVVTEKNGKYLTGASNISQQDVYLSKDLVDEVIYVLKSRDLIQKVIDEAKITGLEVEEVQDKLSLKQVDETSIIEANLSWISEEEGKKILTSLIKVANVELSNILEVGSINFINNPAVKDAIAGGILGGKLNSIKIVLIGIIIGLFIGIASVTVSSILNPTLTTVSDVESVLNLDIIGQIPNEKSFFDLKEIDMSSQIMENYSTSAYALRGKLRVKGIPKYLYVTSTEAREGKTATAIGLALSYAEMEKKVLLVDFNLRSPGVGRRLFGEIEYLDSVNAVFVGESKLKDIVKSYNTFLDVICSVQDRGDYVLNSLIFEEIKKIEKSYDYVIIDAPSMEKASDVLFLNALAKEAVLVVGYDKAVLRNIKDSVEKLDKSEVRLVGSIITMVPTKLRYSSSNKMAYNYRRESENNAGWIDNNESNGNFEIVHDMLSEPMEEEKKDDLLSSFFKE